MNKLPSLEQPTLDEIDVKYETEVLKTPAERLEVKEALATIFDEAFADDEIIQNTGYNLIRNMPEKSFTNPLNLLVTIKDQQSGEIEGFTFLARINNETYSALLTCVKPNKQGKGLGTKLLDTRDSLLKQQGVKQLLTIVDKEKGLARILKKRYQVEDISEILHTENEDGLMDVLKDEIAPHQQALKLTL